MVAVKAGADAIGLVFYPPSPRAVTAEQAREIVAALPPFVTTVGLFVDPDVSEVQQVLATVPLGCLQFHGDELARFCEQFDRPYIKAVRMRDDIDIAEAAATYKSTQALLLDTYVADVAGGTGQQFEWSRVPRHCDKSIILAGGLTVENVAQAIEQTQPYAVDVSGGVEQSRGIKDHDRIRAFIKEVNRVGTG